MTTVTVDGPGNGRLADSRVVDSWLEFVDLSRAASACRLCPRMADTGAVLSQHNGNPDCPVMFVAEAPGRFGAARTGIPLCGDQSGRNFDLLLKTAGLKRRDVFITNAVLCNPRDANGRNARPSTAELANCQTYLKRTLEIVDPAIVVALGSVALFALDNVVPHGLRLRTDVAKLVSWDGRILVPLYHPSSRARVHRSVDQQRQDFVKLGRLVRETCG